MPPKSSIPILLITILLLVGCSNKDKRTVMEDSKGSREFSGTRTYYSDMGIYEETGDCGGYTVRIDMDTLWIGMDTLKEVNVRFVSHQGNCNINGLLVDSLVYNAIDSTISFTYPLGNGNAFYRFNGKIYPDYLRGYINVVYHDSTYNIIDTVVLMKQDSSFLLKDKPG